MKGPSSKTPPHSQGLEKKECLVFCCWIHEEKELLLSVNSPSTYTTDESVYIRQTQLARLPCSVTEAVSSDSSSLSALTDDFSQIEWHCMNDMSYFQIFLCISVMSMREDSKPCSEDDRWKGDLAQHQCILSKSLSQKGSPFSCTDLKPSGAHICCKS